MVTLLPEAQRYLESEMRYLRVRESANGKIYPIRLDDNLIIEDISDPAKTFEVDEFVVKSGNGTVFTGWRIEEGGWERSEKVAIKFLTVLDQRRRDRFENEKRILSKLEHPMIATFLGSGLLEETVEVPWMAMQMRGKNLDYLSKWTKRIPFSKHGIRHAGRQLCDALAYIHDLGIIHRDLKPANVVLERDDPGLESVSLIDFGLAKYTNEDLAGRALELAITDAEEKVGPQSFMSPELLAYARDKRHPVDHRSDLFQLGLVLWFMATGAVLAGVPSKARDPFGGPLRNIVLELLQELPEDRPQDAATVSHMLAELPV